MKKVPMDDVILMSNLKTRPVLDILINKLVNHPTESPKESKFTLLASHSVNLSPTL